MNELNLKDRLIELIGKMSTDHQKDLLDSLEKQQRGFRKYPRSPCSMETNYTIDDSGYKDLIENISAGGVYIKTNHTHSLGQVVTMTFMLAGHFKSITVTGKIIRISDQGFAVKFNRELQEYFINLEKKIKADIKQMQP